MKFKKTLAALLLASTVNYVGEKPLKNPIDRYAIVVVGSDSGERGKSLADPIDKNSFWLHGTYVYGHLEKLGFNHKNMYFLYANGKPDFDEPLNKKTIQKIKQNEFNGPINQNKSSIKNLQNLLMNLSMKIDDNDLFVLSISTHGDPFFLEMDDGKSFDVLLVNKLQLMLEKIKPGIGIVYVDACYSGAYIKKLNLDNYVLFSGTQENKLGWGDRNFSSSGMFFKNLYDLKSDQNKDGKITLNEAFQKTKIESGEYWSQILPYLLKKYNWQGENPYKAVKSISLQPTMIVGKKSSDQIYLFDYWE